ncbi:PAS domain-containing hybrid sensor histidine kinase/response regulator [Actinoplanes sp. M2I2]|uniref:PAS domain-containing hybrid sensor histidine kinase/response regulator n=1 Tax=Actinoplanes sp. M2I2 TaxID=1734444 RepID=UPI0020227675|nr:PAS domain-containing hybrid sensor histidine kinase/response regulator [Actinoplanes sp. M2I2]
MTLAVVTSAYVVIFAWMGYRYLRRADPLLRDVMWMFACVAMLFVLGVIRVFGGSPPGVVMGVFVALLLAKPVFTLRLVARLRPVRAWVLPAATGAWAISALPVVLSSTAVLPRPTVWPAAGVFFCLEALAAWLLAAQARRRGGAARVRLGLAASATALFGVALLVSAVGRSTAVHSRVLALIAGLLYLLAFVPPRRLRRAWSMRTAYATSQQLLTLPPDAPAAETWRRYCYGAGQVLGADLTAVFLPATPGHLQVLAQTDRPLLPHEVTDQDVDRLLADPGTFDALAGWTDPPAVAVELARASNTRYVTATPIATPDGRGALVMLNRYRTLFADDDIALLTELADQAAALARRATLLTERERLAVIVDSSPDAIVGRTLDGVVTSWNAGAEALYGYAAAEVLGRDVAVIFLPGQEQAEQELVRRVAAGERVEQDHVRRRHKDGRTVTVELTLSPITDPAGQVTGVAGISRDISERRRAELMFHRLLEAAPDAMVGVTRDGTITLINAQTERVFGYRRDELIGRNVDILVPERFRAAHPRQRAHYFADPRTRQLGGGNSLAAVRKDGSEFPAEISLSALETDQGLIVSAAIRDVTDRVIAQAERERLIAQAERDASERRLQHTRRLESLGQLAGGVAHDFNNILAIIRNYTELVLDTLDGDQPSVADTAAARDDLRQIGHAAERATGLTKQLLAFGRRDVTQAQVLDLNHVIGDVEQMLRRTLGEHIHLITHLDRELPTVHADPGQLEQILVNLAVNARDAMPGGGTLSIDTSHADLGPDDVANYHLRPGRYVRLRVSDTGAGMPPDVIERAFEPFYTTKPRGAGTGLGLATVYGIATAAGGDVHLYSEVGIGTTVTMLLPATDQPVASGGDRRAEAQPAPRAAANETILMVEDEAALRHSTSRILTRAGYQVLAADGGAQALQLAQTHPGRIDLLLTDVIMPKMVGNEVAARFSALRPGVPVLYMSGYAEPVLTDNGTLPDGVVMVEKPFTSAELLGRVDSILRRSASAGGARRGRADA